MVLKDPAKSAGQEGRDEGDFQPAPGQPGGPPHLDDEPELQPHDDPLEADVVDDGDSALGDDDDDESITTSLASSIKQYRVENGRTYHSYKEGQYLYPNDEAEQDRLDLQHHLHKLTLDGRLYLAPIRQDVQNVLDIGTGTGLWAIEFAEDHPSAIVIGTDLSPIQPPFVPPNLTFIIDDASEPWIFKQKFDYIHARELHCTLDEKRLMDQALENLVPGGWLEMQELSLPISNDDNTWTPNDPIHQWSGFMLEASGRMNQRLDKPKSYAQWMREAGFINVQHQVVKWPMNPWPRDKKHKTLGQWSLANTLEGLDGFTMAYFTRVLGWQPEQVQVFLIGVREDNKNRAKHNYCPVYTVWGQKPK